MRADDEPSSTWCDLGPYRACLQPLGAEQLRFWVHGKPDFSRGYAQAVVLTSGWVQGDALRYVPGAAPLTNELERELTVAARRLTLRVVDGDD